MDEKKDTVKELTEIVNEIKDGVTQEVEKASELISEKMPEVKEKAEKAKKVAKKAAKEATKQAKDTAKKVSAKITAPDEEIFVEFADAQVSADDIKKQIKEAYVAAGNKATAMKKLRIYLNTNERKAYYVINDEETGSYIEF